MLWTFGEGRSSAAVKGTDLHGNGLLNSPRSSYLQFVFFILGRANASPSNTQGGSPVRESRPPGSVRGVLSDGHSYRDSPNLIHPNVQFLAQSGGIGFSILSRGALQGVSFTSVKMLIEAIETFIAGWNQNAAQFLSGPSRKSTSSRSNVLTQTCAIKRVFEKS